MQDKNYIGVDIGGTNITAGLLSNNILVKKAKRNTGADRSAQLILETLYDVIREVWADHITGIGIGVPGFLDIKNGKILLINNIPSFSGLHLTQEVAKVFKVPVFINNDANSFVLGESLFGAGSKYDNIVGLTLGTGLGGGIVVNRRVVSGIFGGAGEFGCIPYLDSTFENYCSGKFFKKTFNVSGEDLYKRAENGDEFALSAFEDYGKHIGNLIRIIMYFIAPETIIVGGSISQSFKYFEKAIYNSFLKLPEEHLRTSIIVAKASLSDASILGAAAVAMNNIADQNVK